VAKKSPPHLVMVKQPTIVNKDPFQTTREEDGIKAAIHKVGDRWFNLVTKSLKSYYETREMESIEYLLKAMGITELETEDLKALAYEFVQKGYLKGVKLTSVQLKQLNISIDINLNDKVHQKALDALKNKLEKQIDTWGNNLYNQIKKTVLDNQNTELNYRDLLSVLQDQYNISLKDADRWARDAIIDSARDAELKTMEDAGVEIFRWITVIDAKTCDVCIALNGRLYYSDPLGEGLINYDTGDYLEQELADLAATYGLEAIIDTAFGRYGPMIHGSCRCHLQPVLTAAQYKGTVQTIISEV